MPKNNISDRVTLTICEVCLATGVSRSKLYEEIAGGRLSILKLGKRTLIHVRDLDRWLDGLRSVEEA